MRNSHSKQDASRPGISGGHVSGVFMKAVSDVNTIFVSYAKKY